MAQTATREKIEECFMLFDQERTGELTIGKFHTAVRALGSIGGYPTEKELQGYSSTIGGQRVSKRIFVNIMEKRVSDFHSKYKGGARTFFQNTANPFKVLDTKNTGYINGRELRNILTTLNETEAISNSDFEKLLHVTGIENDDGDIDYERLYQNMKDLLLA